MIPYSESDYPGCVPGPDNEPMIHMGMRCDGRDEKGLTADDPNAGVIRCCPVSIHYWRPDKVEIENIVANGAGTTLETVETDEPGVFHAWQNWQNNQWTVIMGRVLDAPAAPELPPDTELTHVGPGGNLVDLAPGGTYPMVWGNWDGSKDERNGSKFIGLWGTLSIAP
jgi:DMSO reductase family type II enzyme heme b subunit